LRPCRPAGRLPGDVLGAAGWGRFGVARSFAMDPSAMDVEEIRREFPISDRYNFQDHAAVAPLSRRAGQAMRWYITTMEDEATLGASFYDHIEGIRALAARLINAEAAEVTFIKNTSEGLAFVANGLEWRPGDNVVTTNVEFPANMYPWMNLQRYGVELRTVAEQDGRIPLENILAAIDERTRLVTISAVQYASGYRVDLAGLGRACREQGVLFCVDAIQALGVLPVDVRAMCIDLLAADGHKWLCGPEGAGIFYCRRELLTALRPSTVGWMCMKNFRDYGNYQFEFLEDARRFDSGSYNVAGICGLGASIRLLLEVGIENIARHVLDLTDRLASGVTAKGYRLVSSRRAGEASGIVTFGSPVHDPQRIRRRLLADHRVVISVREGNLRASPHLYNTPEEIDQLVDLLPAH